MFLAISKAEAIHAENHKKVLEKLGEKVGPTETGKFEVMTTAENLADALKVETGGVDSMYPGFITTAETEKATDAYKTFTWAVDTEKRYQVFFRTAIDALAAGGEKNLALKWFVCPVCGNTYDERDVSESCDFCMTSKEKYLVFQAP
jgi:rubrerythrin